jgi:hypothetical protein
MLAPCINGIGEEKPLTSSVGLSLGGASANTQFLITSLRDKFLGVLPDLAA